MKKIVVAGIGVMLVGALLCSCGKTTAGSNSAVSNSETASSVPAIEEVDVLEECKLSEEEMMVVIKDYYKVFEAVMQNSGDPVTFEITEDDTGVTVTAMREGQEPSATNWESVRSAYEFLYRRGQVDLDGNLLVSEENLLSTGG